MTIASDRFARRLALFSALLLLCAQTLVQAHVHESASEAPCVVCTVSADDAPLTDSSEILAVDAVATTVVHLVVRSIDRLHLRHTLPRAPPRT